MLSRCLCLKALLSVRLKAVLSGFANEVDNYVKLSFKHPRGSCLPSACFESDSQQKLFLIIMRISLHDWLLSDRGKLLFHFRYLIIGLSLCRQLACFHKR